MPASDLRLASDGAELHAGAAGPAALARIVAALAEQPTDRAGVRLSGLHGLAEHLVDTGAMGSVAASALGTTAHPVRAVLFDKNAATNWALAWHQDRTIVVRLRLEVDGYSPWTTKAGMQHVQPPHTLLEQMVTLRLHIDPVDADNAPLLVAPGSHRLGRVAECDVPAAVRRCGVVACMASAGDVWAYSTPILHASHAAARPRHRRVLQVDYSASRLPGGLDWLGV